MDRLSLSGKAAIVTGSSSGLGAAIAELFARRGALVTITGRNLENLEKTKEQCIKAGASESQIFVIPGDITSDDTRKALIEKTLAQRGKLDILVNNAGVALSGAPLIHKESSLDAYDTMMDVNLRSVIRLTQLAVDHLKKTKGNIVNVSSVAGVNASRQNGFYNVSKAGLDQFTKCLSLELAAEGVRVNSVNPGAIDTPTFSRMYNTEEEKQQFMATMGRVHPMDRVGQPHEVAEAVAFLASDAASFTTGNLLMVDGARSLMIPRFGDM